MTLLRRTAAALLVTALAGVGVAMAAVPAEAASSYRYWSYWYAGPAATSWTYGPIGPAGHTVVDGSVEGWRFVVSAPNPSAPSPRHAASSAFKDICGGTARPAGQVRVALVVDFGTSADAPPHESPPGSVTGTCVVVPEGSKGLTVLNDAGFSPRISGGLVCGLSGYPAHECGVVVKDPSPTPTPKPSPSKPKPTTSTGAPAPPATRSPSASAGSPGTCCASPTPSASSATAPATSSIPSPTDSATELPGATETGDPALTVGPPPPPAGGPGPGTPAGLLLGGALVVGVGAAAVLRNRGQHQGERGTA